MRPETYKTLDSLVQALTKPLDGRVLKDKLTRYLKSDSPNSQTDEKEEIITGLHAIATARGLVNSYINNCSEPELTTGVRNYTGLGNLSANPNYRASGPIFVKLAKYFDIKQDENVRPIIQSAN